MNQYKRIICVGSSPVHGQPFFLQTITDKDFIIAVDGGFSFIRSHGITPSLIVGDLDSINPADVDEARKANCAKLFLPSEKDESDFEVAIQYIIQNFSNSLPVVLLNMTEGRPDHAITTLFASKILADNGFTAVFLGQAEDVYVVPSNQSIEIQQSVGTLLSLFPLDSIVSGVTTKNLKYPLNSENLYQYSSRSLSNVFIEKKCTIIHKSGVLAVYVLKEKKYENIC